MSAVVVVVVVELSEIYDPGSQLVKTLTWPFNILVCCSSWLGGCECLILFDFKWEDPTSAGLSLFVSLHTFFHRFQGKL